MAKNESRRVRPVIMQEDRDALSAIKGYKNPVYQPANAAFSLEKLTAAQTTLVDLREAEVQAQNAADDARDATVAAEWAFHNIILEAKNQVKAQYGEDSDEYAGLGLIKKSERQAPSIRTAAVPATA